MSAATPERGWQVRLLKPRQGILGQPIRPAEVGEALCDAMLASENLVEDAQYQKICPSEFVVEVPPDDYAHGYAPLEPGLAQQWRERLLNHLTTSNSRQGRREYRFAGQVAVAIRAAADLAAGQVRIRSRLSRDGAAPETAAQAVLPGCLELLPDGKRWPLPAGLVTIGRDPACAICIDLPRVQELRMVSGQHAYLQCGPGSYRLFDGTPTGAPSVNGTFVNQQPVGAGGQPLQDGDIVILAALRPEAPTLATPGVAGLRFRANCD